MVVWCLELGLVASFFSRMGGKARLESEKNREDVPFAQATVIHDQLDTLNGTASLEFLP